MTRAVALLSGGLDSTLACKLMLDQGIEIYAVNFITPFCTCTKKGCKLQAKKVAENFDIPLKVIYAGEEYIQLVKNPPHGYGSNMNPCIDCRIYMFSHAKDAFEHEEDSLLDIKLLKLGRHFRLPSGARVVIGRDEQENKSIVALAGGEDLLLEACDVPGPITLLKNGEDPEDVVIAASICLRYSDFEGMESKVSYWKAENGQKMYIKVAKAGVEFLEKHRI